MLSTWFIIVAIDLDHLAEAVLVRFFHWKVTFVPLPILYSLEGNHYVQPTVQEWGGLLSPSLLEGAVFYINYLSFLHGRLVSSPLFNPLYQYGFVDIYFILILWITVKYYFVAQIVSALAIGSSLFGFYVPLTYPHSWFLFCFWTHP